jgi:SAM-dependent methyltransferase
MELLLGCGYNRDKRMYIDNRSKWTDLVTVDHNCECLPDLVYDLNDIPLPFADNSVDEIHCYHVLEHMGVQGDYVYFFDQFNDFYRILKPNGYFFGQCPSYKSEWAFGDPGHTRIFTTGSLVFLSKFQYAKQIDQEQRNMTDYRKLLQCDFDIISSFEDNHVFHFILKAIKND